LKPRNLGSQALIQTSLVQNIIESPLRIIVRNFVNISGQNLLHGLQIVTNKAPASLGGFRGFRAVAL